MVFSQSFKVEFNLDGKAYKCPVDKIRILDHRPEVFYRISAQSGNRDLICHEGKWLVINGKPLPGNLLDVLGEAIEAALQSGI
jgi:hypothetical protein